MGSACLLSVQEFRSSTHILGLSPTFVFMCGVVAYRYTLSASRHTWRGCPIRRFSHWPSPHLISSNFINSESILQDRIWSHSFVITIAYNWNITLLTCIKQAKECTVQTISDLHCYDNIWGPCGRRLRQSSGITERYKARWEATPLGVFKEEARSPIHAKGKAWSTTSTKRVCKG